MYTGIYEQLITQLLHEQWEAQKHRYHIHTRTLDPAEAAGYLSAFIHELFRVSLESVPHGGAHGGGESRLQRQVKLANEFVQLLADRLPHLDLQEHLLHSPGTLLTALFDKNDPIAAEITDHVAKITPQTGLVQSELFTGSNTGLSLESEMRREILSADEICWLVSFIKWTGIRIFAEELKRVTAAGTTLRVITTSYMGATDQKAVDFLASLSNTQVRLNYNTDRERLHAKAYLFKRNSGFHTGYIGSSNISRSALTNGLEWNLKLTTREIPHILDKFYNTFETYWQSPEFEPYHTADPAHRQRLHRALRTATSLGEGDPTVFFDIQPHPYQKEILETLRVERELHHRYQNLVVAATGTGKTIISAFDFRRMYKTNPGTRLLFVAHREEILKQARATFRAVLREPSFGELMGGGESPQRYDQLFATVQTLTRRMPELALSRDYFDYIVIDEVHHIAAQSYQPILKRFRPHILLGLTATPERHDGEDILRDFCGTIAAELRLPDAINQRHLCPFHYFAVDDPVDLSRASWERGRYLPGELTRIYTANDQRVLHILQNLDTYVHNVHRMKALAFCVSQEHASYMADKFQRNRIPAAVLTSNNAHERRVLREQLGRGEINVLCVVDIFNEGVDIPEIDTVLFLRPTESLTVFLQQLGRGLRLSEGKDCLTVLDFVGNGRREYDFSHKFRALVGRSHTSIEDEIQNDFPHAPLGCAIVLHKQAREVILRNIRQAIVNRQRLLQWLRTYPTHSNRPLSLRNFLYQYPNIELSDIYKLRFDKGGGWTRLQYEAGLAVAEPDPQLESVVFRSIGTRFLPCTSPSYLQFIQDVFAHHGQWDQHDPIQRQFALMLHYDTWQTAGPQRGFSTLAQSLHALVHDPQLAEEVQEVVAVRMDAIDTAEIPMNIPFDTAVHQHARYTRDQILSAFGVHRFEQKASSREGVVFIRDLNCELLFVTLQKTAERFSPTTLYHDYALSEELFHWQSQNSARPDRGRGLSYKEQHTRGTTIILFVREQDTDQHKRTMGFVCLGPVTFVESEGSQPMNIIWRLHTPLPPWLWHSAAKLAVG